MYINKQVITIEGGHLAGLIFLPDNQPEDGAEVPMKAMVIACHGFRGGKENGGRVYSLGHKLTAIGLGLLAFDFGGSGESSGKFTDVTISLQAADLQSVISYVEDNYNVPVVVLGRSLGGSTVLAACAADKRPVAAILWSTPAMVRETFANILGDAARQLAAGQIVRLQDEYSSYELGPAFWQDLDRHDFDRYVMTAGRSPLLVIHGEADEVVPVDNALKIKKLVSGSQVITVPGADHKFINGWELREDFTVAWLNHLFS